jgi:phosphate acetyltransferase
VFGDCAINPNPTAEQLAEIAISSADSSMALASSLKLQCYPIPLVPPERGDEVDKVRKATQIVREKRPDLK